MVYDLAVVFLRRLPRLREPHARPAFDDDGLLRWYELLKADAPVIRLSGYDEGIQVLLPRDLEEDRARQMQLGRASSASRQATVPSVQW